MPLSGKQMMDLFLSQGWKKIRQRGSHVVLRLGSEITVIPMHKELKTGLEHALLKRLRGSK